MLAGGAKEVFRHAVATEILLVLKTAEEVLGAMLVRSGAEEAAGVLLVL